MSTNPAQKALWFIESHLDQDLTLDAIAAVAGVSRYHLSRAFATAFGHSPVRYLRARRLSLAAGRIRAGAPNLLEVALDSGYNSHEAFTRAFREEFGVTPESLRDTDTPNIQLKEPIKMDDSRTITLDPPRFVDAPSFLIAGISERYTAETAAAIPNQWQRFVPHLGHIPDQVGRTTYGVVCNSDDVGNTEYVCGVEVTGFARIPADWARLRIPEHRYAVFTHSGHVSTIRHTWYTIFNRWLPESGFKPDGSPEFEKYGERFNGMTGEGGFEIWIPIQSA